MNFSPPPLLSLHNLFFLRAEIVCCFSSKRRNRGKKQNRDENQEEIQDQNKLEGMLNGMDLNDTANISIKDLQAAMKAFTLQQRPAKTPEEALTKSYQFWSTQPVPKMGVKFAQIFS